MTLKIKSLIILGLVVLCQANYTEKQEQMLDDIAEQCGMDMGIKLNDDFVQLFKFTGDLPNDDDSQEFITCALHKIDAVDEDGYVIADKFVDFESDGHDLDAVKEVVEKCAKVEGDSVNERGYNFYKCFWDEKKYEI
ncbi:uncharacterized protein LOC131428423 [Malaya genurostris]|uniref:uncharacterized protein LOC131428423 n=1 Tax=Malaya genurostris TaxID=325434 RepID=UPI0026F3DDE2|nr:uncharacterized protein LOC131428423 [Malaya genurostris]